MTLARDHDVDIEAMLDALRAQARSTDNGELERTVEAVRDAVVARMTRLETLLEDVRRFGDEVRAQNETLRLHAARLEVSEREANRLVVALADANAAAVVQMAEVDAQLVDAEAARRAILAERESLAREATELRVQSASLAEANVAMLLLAEERAEQVEALETRCQQEREEKSALRAQALVDRLTGLYNRRYYDEQFQREFARARRYERSLSILFIDVDHFKNFNDTHGHGAGDHLLSELAGVVRATVRDADIVSRAEGTPFAARYGGEEFTVILPETPLAGAAVVAERIRLAVASTALPGGELQPGGRITISAGVASLLPADGSAADLARRADAALYRAKRSGRDRVVTASAEGDLVAA